MGHYSATTPFPCCRATQYNRADFQTMNILDVSFLHHFVGYASASSINSALPLVISTSTSFTTKLTIVLEATARQLAPSMPLHLVEASNHDSGAIRTLSHQHNISGRVAAALESAAYRQVS